MRHHDLLLRSYLQDAVTKDGLVQDTQIVIPFGIDRQQQLEAAWQEEFKCRVVYSEQRAGKNAADAGLDAPGWI